MQVEAFGHEFELINDEKVDRAINGTLGRLAMRAGGVGEDATGEQKIAEYDRLGGGITLNGDRVKPGCFYDFKTKKPFAEPDIQLQFAINGKKVEVAAGEPLPPLVQAAKKAEQGVVEDAEEEKPSRKSTTLIGSGKKAAKKADEGAA